MMWWITLAGLALAQDDATRTERLLGEAPEAEAAPVMAADPVSPAVEAPAQPSPAPAATPAPAPVQAPTPAPPTTSVAEAFDAGWMWSLGGPLALLVLAGAGAWYVRRKGVNVQGLLKHGFTSLSADGPLVEVGSRTPLAGQDVLAVVQVTGAGRPRQLLVATGPQGASLIADLSPEAPAAAAPAGTVSADAIEAAVQRALRTAQGIQAQAPAPVPVMAAPAVAPSPAEAPRAEAPRAAAAPRAVEAPIQEEPRAVEAPIQEGPRPVETPVQEVPRPVEAPAMDARRPVPPPQGDQDEEAFARTLQDHLDRASSRQAPADDADERADWRTAAFLDRAGPDRTLAEEDIGPAVRVRRSARARDLTRQTRDEAPQERPRAGRSRDVRKGHLEQLVRKGPRPQRRRVRGNGVRNYDPAARRERTEAARALLEQVMARREREGR